MCIHSSILTYTGCSIILDANSARSHTRGHLLLRWLKMGESDHSGTSSSSPPSFASSSSNSVLNSCGGEGAVARVSRWVRRDGWGAMGGVGGAGGDLTSAASCRLLTVFPNVFPSSGSFFGPASVHACGDHSTCARERECQDPTMICEWLGASTHAPKSTTATPAMTAISGTPRPKRPIAVTCYEDSASRTSSASVRSSPSFVRESAAPWAGLGASPSCGVSAHPPVRRAAMAPSRRPYPPRGARPSPLTTPAFSRTWTTNATTT